MIVTDSPDDGAGPARRPRRRGPSRSRSCWPTSGWTASPAPSCSRGRATLHPRAKRGLLVDFGAWGDPPTAAAIRHAMAVGDIDYYVLKPWRDHDELFHRTISEFFYEWSRIESGETARDRARRAAVLAAGLRAAQPARPQRPPARVRTVRLARGPRAPPRSRPRADATEPGGDPARRARARRPDERRARARVRRQHRARRTPRLRRRDRRRGPGGTRGRGVRRGRGPRRGGDRARGDRRPGRARARGSATTSASRAASAAPSSRSARTSRRGCSAPASC